jgi:hypothetical protein
MFKGEVELEAELEDLMSILAESELEFEAEAELTPAKRTRARDVASDLIRDGVTDENRVTDAVFYDLNPTWKDKKLPASAAKALKDEWTEIRNRIVRPLVKEISCSGWERDPESFAKRAAEHHLKGSATVTRIVRTANPPNWACNVFVDTGDGSTILTVQFSPAEKLVRVGPASGGPMMCYQYRCVAANLVLQNAACPGPASEFEAELEDLMSVLSESNLEAEAEGIFGPIQTFVRTFREQAIINDQIAHGVRDENRLTDAIFFDRYPSWKGKALKNAGLALRQEWIQIRDAIVRPALASPPAVQPPAPVAPAAPPAPVQPTGTFGFSNFLNIHQYRPDQYSAAVAAQDAYQKVAGFQPYFSKISSVAPNVGIATAREGVGNLVFSLDYRSLGVLVESSEIRDKAIELMTHGAVTRWITSYTEPPPALEFTEKAIGILGIGLTMIDIARGLENERMLGGFDPGRDQWIRKQQFQFVFGLMAEDISRRNWGDGYFYSRNVRDLAVELAVRYAEFQPIYYRYAPFFWMESDLSKYGGQIPQNRPQTMGLPPPGM